MPDSKRMFRDMENQPRWKRTWERVSGAGKVVNTASAAHTLWTWRDAILLGVLFVMNSTFAAYTTFVTDNGWGAVPLVGAVAALLMAWTLSAIAKTRYWWLKSGQSEPEYKLIVRTPFEVRAEERAAKVEKAKAIPLSEVGKKLEAIDEAIKILSGAPWPIEDRGRKLYENAWSAFVHTEKNIEYDSWLSAYVIAVKDLRAQLDELLHKFEHYPDVVGLMTTPDDLPWQAAYLYRNAWNSLLVAAPSCENYAFNNVLELHIRNLQIWVNGIGAWRNASRRALIDMRQILAPP